MTNERMTFPETWEEYEKDYGFNDSKEVYTNNSRLIPSFRVKQWLDHLPSIQPKPKTEVLDKIRAEIEEEYGYCNICEYFEDYDYEDNDISEYRYVASVKDILQIIDKYKAESEAQDADSN